MAKKIFKEELNVSEKYDLRICKMTHKILEKEIKDLKEKDKKLNDQLETEIENINSKIDKLDLNLTGNDKIGINEQLRLIKWKFRIVFIILILLLGFKVFGAKLGDIIHELMNNYQSVAKIEKNIDNSK